MSRTALPPTPAPSRRTPPRIVRLVTRPGPWRRGRIPAALALLLGLLLMLHAHLTDRFGLGSLVETFLPWCGALVPLLLLCGLWRRSAAALVALLVPTVVWVSMFGSVFSDRSSGAGGDLTVAEHNVAEANPDPAGTARSLAGSGADVLALVEVTDQALGTYEKELAGTYPYHAALGTVGLWSKLPLSGVRTVDIRTDAGPLGATKTAAEKLPGNRALRATVATDRGPLAVYVAHLGSVRVMPRGGFWTESRDRNATALGEALAAERSARVVLLGDLNGTTDDRAFDSLTDGLRSAQDESGSGFGFTWPASFPMVRIDQILLRGVHAEKSWVLPGTGSDHLPVAADISW
ncbi:hypothetical protein GTW43_37060 [Streptomyces sp. SID5785]|uniref:endonuclease/exonuclease/phosphatase family protein n=1 Tax=Streptomyces sp. SID5785 TaxID=2690309 RepID=UPI0013612D86|nr:endonuclease/exonuclease/phosphatase family protein [Streptomyces sp. SID5785]MZD10648.1 hypothetical protein [Streptomyces sp. SID5785]